MKFRATLLFAVALAGVATVVAPARIAAAETAGQITILYDAFGGDAAMKKDWGFSALVEISGKRILFDTGNERGHLRSNVEAKNIDLTSIDFVVLSHRHSDHMAGLNHVLSVNPTVKIYAPKEGLRHLRLVAAGELLPQGRILAAGDAILRRQAAGSHEVRHRVAASQHRARRQDNGNRPGHHADRAGVRRARHEGAQGVVAGRGHRPTAWCSWSAARTRGSKRSSRRRRPSIPKFSLIAGGFHLVVAPDQVIAKAVAALKNTFKVENIAPGHCTGEPTFTALKQAFGDRYLYAGVGTSLPLGSGMGSVGRRGEGPALREDDLATYRKLARAKTRSAFFGAAATQGFRTVKAN